jgi:hypothetical protein
MSRWIAVTVSSIAFAVASPSAFGEEKIVFIEILQTTGSGAGERQTTWQLGMINGGLGFMGALRDVADTPEMPSIPHDKSGTREEHRFLRKDDTLQIDVVPFQQAESKVQAEKHHWFLTAKYTDKGGEVILTKEATKYSHWKFLDEDLGFGSDFPQYHIKNLNDLGKDAWLGMELNGVRYRGHAEIRKPIVSFETKQFIGIEKPIGK